MLKENSPRGLHMDHLDLPCLTLSPAFFYKKGLILLYDRCRKYAHSINMGCLRVELKSSLTGYSWDQPQGAQHTEGSKGFNIKSTWLTPVPMHWCMGISFNFSLFFFGQKLQCNTEESVGKQRKSLTLVTSASEVHNELSWQSLTNNR